jgi:hypothetical protein
MATCMGAYMILPYKSGENSWSQKWLLEKYTTSGVWYLQVVAHVLSMGKVTFETIEIGFRE